MKLIVFFILIFIGSAANAQQSLFNAPSSEITHKNYIFFQQQLNLNGRNVTSNSTFDYGLGKGWEIGVNLFGINYNYASQKLTSSSDGEEEPLAPQLLMNMQKHIEMSHWLDLAIGTQIGTSLVADGTRNHLSNWTFVNTLQRHFHDRLKLNFGMYYANKYYEGIDETIGFMGGVDYEINQKVHFMADFISGKNAIGSNVIGFVYYATKNIPLSFGWQTPFDKSKNQSCFVFEFTYIP